MYITRPARAFYICPTLDHLVCIARLEAVLVVCSKLPLLWEKKKKKAVMDVIVFTFRIGV